MQESNEIKDKLINEFSESYVEKLFYFCLKKTGNQDEADDLTQDITLQIVAALNKGTVPDSFSAWIWQIARNRYSVWAKEKHNRNESVTDTDVYDCEIEDANENVSDELIHSEQMALLRRELAFIKSDYRNIVVAYYIENKSIRDIASALSLSESAVKQRLFRARNILKEGMEMARTFGKRSYNPENIEYSFGGKKRDNGTCPWDEFSRKIQSNILLQANNNPSTIEELSIELGIAVPYMEEEVKILLQSELLEQQGDKYITNFPILDKDCRMEIYNILRETAKERSRLIQRVIEDIMDEVRFLGIAAPHIDDNTIYWFLVMSIIDLLIEGVVGHDGESPSEPHQRANGEYWEVIGYEITELPEATRTDRNVIASDAGLFAVYKYPDYSMWEQCGEPLDPAVVDLMCNYIKENKKITLLNDHEKRVWEFIDGRYAHMSEDGYLIPDIIVWKTDCFDKVQSLSENKNMELLCRNVDAVYKKVGDVLKKCNHQILHKYIGFYIGTELFSMRMMAVHDLVEEGFLKLPDDPNKSSLGMFLWIF